MLVRRILEESGLPRAQVARDAGLSYDALHAWSVGRRTPEAESLRKLAVGLRHRSEQLAELARELERAVGN